MGSRGRVWTGMKFITKSDEISSTIALLAGSMAINVITVNLNVDDLLMAKIYRSVWLDSRTGDNWFPAGANVDFSKFPVYSEGGAYYTLDSITNVLTPLDDNIDQSVMFLQNNDSSTHNLIFDGAIRFILNKGSFGQTI